MVGLMRELLTDMAVPLPVQYELLHPGYASLHYPADRKQYRIYGGPYYDPYQEIRQSVAYLRRNNFVIRAEHLPMIFVRKWQSAPPGWYHYLTTPDDTDMIFRLRETPRHDHLSLKVFAYAYAVRHDMWAGGREPVGGRRDKAVPAIPATVGDHSRPAGSGGAGGIVRPDGFRRI